MRDPEQFDAFYKDARDRLLVQAFAATGDLKAARTAVRDTFVSAWHHWRKVSRQDPEAWARPHAWNHAHRRHATRPWHHEKGLDPELAATLQALGKLSWTHRRVLLLTHLAATSLPEMAREVGLTAEDTARHLQSATAQLAVARDVPSTSIPLLLRSLDAVVADVRWPRASIIRRSGTARRRTHTLVGVAAAVASVAVTGAVVADPAGVRPTLERSTVAVSAPRAPSGPAAPAEPEPSLELDGDALVSAAQVADLLPGRGWEERETHDNTHGDGRLVTCQAARYADPRAVDALVREVRTPRSSDPRRRLVTTTEVSRHEKAAGRALARWTEWIGRCSEDRTQLLSTSDVARVGDEAVQLVVRSWADPLTTRVVGVARTGRYVTTTVSEVRAEAVEAEANARLLAAAVQGVCDLEGAGACADPSRDPRITPRDPVPVAEVPTMVAEADLPPVGGVDQPWVGTRTQRPKGQNAAATRCDQTSFQGTVGGRRFTRTATRTFLIPEADLPVEFGLTETVGTLAPPAARAFVSAVRRKMASCSDRELGTEVLLAADRTGAREELAVWHVTVEVSEQRSVKYFMAMGRSGDEVMQLGFIPAPGVEMRRGAFLALAERGLQRLRSGS